MAIKKQLTIMINPDGSLNIKTDGFKGSECEEELRPIEKALGKVTARTRTSDYYKISAAEKNKIDSTTK
jgi:hypothetical protein